VRGGPWGADLPDGAPGAPPARVEIGPGGAVARFAPGVLPIAAPEDHPWPEAWRAGLPGADPFSPGRLAGQIAGASAA